MSRETPVNMSASITARLHNLAQALKWNYNYLLLRYANERFLYRLSISPYAEKFILKGSSLFIVWQHGNAYRQTMDADFMYYGNPDAAYMRDVFAEICKMGGSDADGMVYDAESVTVEPIRIGNEYGGSCITVKASLGNARLLLQFDVGIGDAITPDQERIPFPVLLNGTAPVLRTYPKATVIAEKTHAMVTRGEQNSRMKDFADLYTLAMEFEFDYATLRLAMTRTFERRETPGLTACPFCFTEEFANSAVKRTQWKAFLRKNALTLPADFGLIVERLTGFLLPVLLEPRTVPVRWDPKDGWKTDLTRH